METTIHPGSPLHQRMLEGVRMRKLAPKTRDAYIQSVSQYLGLSPDTASAEDLRRYQLHLIDAGTSPTTLNATITGLKFLFDVTLGHGDVPAKMRPRGWTLRACTATPKRFFLSPSRVVCRFVGHLNLGMNCVDRHAKSARYETDDVL